MTQSLARRGLLLGGGATLLAGPRASAQAPRPMRVVGVELPPLIMSTPYGATGIFTETCQLAFERAGQRAEFEVVPWARGVSMLKSGEADGLMPTIRSAEREALFDFPDEPAYRSEMSFFGRTDQPPRWSGKLADLQSYGFVKLRGALFAPEFDQAVREGRIHCEEASSFSACIRMVDARRVDFAAIPKPAGLQIIAAEGLGSRIAPIEPPVHAQDFYLAFARKPELADVRRQFSLQLGQILRNGQAKAIEDAYRLRRWLPPERAK